MSGCENFFKSSGLRLISSAGIFLSPNFSRVSVLFLRIKCKIHAFGDDAPYEFMVVLCCSFLIGCRRVTVEQMCSAIPLMVKFDSGLVGKFTAVPTFYAFNGIDLYDRGVRMESHMAAVIPPGASDTAGLIDFELNRFCLSRTL